MHASWNRKIVAGIMTHFANGLAAQSIPCKINTEEETVHNEWVEVRVTDLFWRESGQRQKCRLAVNLLCSTPSSNDTLQGDFDTYRIEDMLGICQALLVSISIDGLPCLNPITVAGKDMQQFRPRQVDKTTKLVQASVTGYYELTV